MHHKLAFTMAIVGLGLSVAPALAADLADRVPADTLVYLSWPGIDTFGPACADTEFAKLMAEPEVQRARQAWHTAIWPAIQERIRSEAKKPEDTAAYEVISGFADALWHRPAALAVVGVDMTPGGPRVDAALFVRAGKGAPDLAARLDRLIELASHGERPAAEVREIEVAGSRWKEVVPPGWPIGFRYGVSGEDFVLAVGTRITEFLAAPLGKALSGSERFAEAMKAVGGSAAVPVGFVDLKAIVSTVEKFQPLLATMNVPVLGEPGGLQRVLASSGLADAQSVSGATVPQADGFRTTWFLHAPTLGRRAATQPAGKPVTDDDLKLIPRDAAWGSVQHMDLLQNYRDTLAAVQAISAPVYAVVLGIIKTGEVASGVRLEEDLLAAFGDTAAVYDAPSSGGLLFTGMTVVTSLRPGNQLDASLRKLVTAVARFVPERNRVRLQQEEHRGQSITYVTVDGLPIPLAPAWAVYEGRLVFALYPQMVRVALDRLMDKGESIVANPDFQRGRKLVPENADSISYADAGGVELAYRLLLPISDALFAMGRAERIPLDPGLMPAMPTVRRHLFGEVSATATTPEGFVFVAHGPWPVSTGGGGSSIIAAAGAGMSMSVLMPSLARARELARRTGSMGNLRQIGVAAHMYATTHDGQFPPDLDALVGAKLIPEKTLRSPNEKADTHISYVYVPGQTEKDDRRNVLAYERAVNYGGEGTAVLFLDGHAEFMNQGQFRRALDETRRRLEESGRSIPKTPGESE